MNIKWDDNIGELVNKWDEIVKSLASSDVIYFKRCYYSYNIRNPVEQYYLHNYFHASNSAYTAIVYIKTVTKHGNISATFVTSTSIIIPLNNPLDLLGEFFFDKSNS